MISMVQRARAFARSHAWRLRRVPPTPKLREPRLVASFVRPASESGFWSRLGDASSFRITTSRMIASAAALGLMDGGGPEPLMIAVYDGPSVGSVEIAVLVERWVSAVARYAAVEEIDQVRPAGVAVSLRYLIYAGGDL